MFNLYFNPVINQSITACEMMLLGKIVVDKNAGKMEELVLLNPRDWKPQAGLRCASKVGLWGGSVGDHVKCCCFFLT